MIWTIYLFVVIGSRILISPLAGVLVDRWNRVKVIYVTDYIRAMLFAILGLYILGNPTQNEIASVNGWIVDTSIEHDHELFSGFLKVSIEEILIALRDDSHFLNDPNGLFTGKPINIDNSLSLEKQTLTTLYPNGFSGGCFIDVIEHQVVWKKRSYR